jgi:thymidylate synthase ThyX
MPARQGENVQDRTIFGDEDGCYATVIADSISPREHRLTTMEIQFWRPVLAEFNTHRVFSRNSASSRAIPVAKQIERIKRHPAGPLVWAAEQRGMQGGDEISAEDRQMAADSWWEAKTAAISAADELVHLGVHKSVVNRLLEPFMWHRVIVSSTEWENFFEQRCSPLAQPEIRQVAEFMREAKEASEPQFVDYNEWHLPYVDDEDTLDELAGGIDIAAPWIPCAQVSAARSARVSYLTHEGTRDVGKDFDLYFGTRDGERHGLISAQPEHWSPLEHPATPDNPFETSPGNFTGWLQLRHHADAKSPRPDAL